MEKRERDCTSVTWLFFGFWHIFCQIFWCDNRCIQPKGACEIPTGRQDDRVKWNNYVHHEEKKGNSADINLLDNDVCYPEGGNPCRAFLACPEELASIFTSSYSASCRKWWPAQAGMHDIRYMDLWKWYMTTNGCSRRDEHINHSPRPWWSFSRQPVQKANGLMTAIRNEQQHCRLTRIAFSISISLAGFSVVKVWTKSYSLWIQTYEDGRWVSRSP